MRNPERRQALNGLQRTHGNQMALRMLHPGVRGILASPGRPLESPSRRFFEQRYGQDFGDVRVHADARAAESARAVQAHAYTVGHHVVLDGAQSGGDPGQQRHLLAHELAHVVQQRRGGEPPPLNPGAAHERQAGTAAGAVSQGLDRVVVRGATGVGLARQTGPPPAPPLLPALTADELLSQLVLALRGFASSPPGIPPIDPNLVGAPMGRGYETYAAIQILNRAGQQVATGIGAYLGGGTPHAEAQAIGALRSSVPANAGLAGGRMIVVVDQAPCPNCASGLRALAKSLGLERFEVYVPSRPSLVSPDQLAGPKTSARGAFQGNRPAVSARLLSSEVLTSTPSGGASAPAAAEPSAPAPAEPRPPAAPTATAPTGQSPGTPQPAAPEGAPSAPTGATPNAPTGAAPTEFRVSAQYRVVSAVRQAAGTLVSELEVTFAEGLEPLNRTATETGGRNLPSRMVVRMTQGADGALIAAEAVTGEPAALAETVARQAISSLPRAAAGAEAGAAGSAGTAAAGAAEGAVARVSPLVRGVAWAGVGLFVIVTGYQLAKATPEQRPRVATTAAGGLVGGTISSYIICNLIFGIETLGWSLIGCSFVAGIPGALAGSGIAGSVYDAARATPVERALHDLEGQPANVRRLFYAMVAQASGPGGLAINEQFIREFMASVPANLRNEEVTALIGQLGPVGATDSIASVLRQLRAAIERLPGRAPRILPPLLDVEDLSRPGEAPPFRINPIGGGRIQLLPPVPQPVPGTAPSREEPSPVRPLIEIRLGT